MRLYEKGLIYRGEYMVNWCPHCQTALSDLEVEHTEEQGQPVAHPLSTWWGRTAQLWWLPRGQRRCWAIRRSRSIRTIARYSDLHGKTVMLPLMDREIPIILDELADPEFGTGVVKITPAHDPNDFEAGKRHDLPKIKVIDETGHDDASCRQVRGPRTLRRSQAWW